MISNTYVYSRLAPESVASYIQYYYDISEILSCEFYVFGLHDNYIVKSDLGKFILRIYRNDWRTADEIHFELELLSFLQKQNLPVSYPLETNQQKLSFLFQSAEGDRFAALFTYAEGEAPSKEITEGESKLLGATVSRVHKATREFQSNYQRKELNLAHLVGLSINLIKPYVTTAQYELLRAAEVEIGQNLSHLSPEVADFGVCFGDVNQTNFHINDDDELTLFDFDQCGYGRRAFELGKYLSSLQKSQSKQALMAAFLAGYESVRKLSDIEKAAIPYFEMASVIWVMSIRVANKNKVGLAYLEESYWSQRLAILKSLMDSQKLEVSNRYD